MAMIHYINMKNNCKDCKWGVDKTCMCPSSEINVINGYCDHFNKKKNQDNFVDKYNRIMPASENRDLEIMILWCAQELDKVHKNKNLVKIGIAELFFDGDLSMAEAYVEHLER
jgi:hypothetical protein